MRTTAGVQVLVIMVALFVCFSCSSGGGGEEKQIPTDLVFYHYGTDQPLEPSGGVIAVSRFLEIRVEDQYGQAMDEWDLYISFSPGDENVLLEKNSDGVWLVDPTGHERVIVQLGELVEDYNLNTTGLIRMDPDQPGDFSGLEPPEYLKTIGDQGEMTFVPGSILSPGDTDSVFHVMYLVDPEDSRTEVDRVIYGGTFSLDLGDYSDVTSQTGYVFKNTLAIVENGKITYETPLSAVATVLIH